MHFRIENSELRKLVGLKISNPYIVSLHTNYVYLEYIEFVKGAIDIFLRVGAVVATISISRYILRFRGVDNTEEVICGFLPCPVADRDKGKCGCCYTESKVVVFSQGTTRSSCANNDDDSGNISVGLKIFARRLRVGLSDAIEMRAIISPLF